jgi:hypothetical protein
MCEGCCRSESFGLSWEVAMQRGTDLDREAVRLPWATCNSTKYFLQQVRRMSLKCIALFFESH